MMVYLRTEREKRRYKLLLSLNRLEQKRGEERGGDIQVLD